MPILYTNVLDQMSEIEYISKSVFYVVNCQFRRQNECLSLHDILRSSKPGTIAELLRLVSSTFYCLIQKNMDKAK